MYNYDELQHILNEAGDDHHRFLIQQAFEAGADTNRYIVDIRGEDIQKRAIDIEEYLDFSHPEATEEQRAYISGILNSGDKGAAILDEAIQKFHDDDLLQHGDATVIDFDGIADEVETINTDRAFDVIARLMLDH